jgi:hypothetical protein
MQCCNWQRSVLSCELLMMGGSSIRSQLRRVEEWRSGGVEEWRSGGVEKCECTRTGKDYKDQKTASEKSKVARTAKVTPR